MISYRCDVNTCDDEGRTPLHVAAMFNQPAILKALIERGASRMIKDKSNNTAIDYSKQKVHVECLLLLLFIVVLHFLSLRNTLNVQRLF